MSCECCTNKTRWLTLKACMAGLKLPLNYCPVCSTPAAIRAFLDNMDKLEIHIPEVITDENGKKLILDRGPLWSPTKEAYTPPDMSVDLDKIDIEREMKILGMKEQLDGN